MKKIKGFGEWVYVLGMILLPLGVTMMEKADLGISMVVAPAYLLSLKIDFLTFGMAEYLLQGVLLGAFCLLMGKFRWTYLLSFVTAFLYGWILDGWMLLFAPVNAAAWGVRIGLYLGGMLVCSLGISLFFHTYLPPEVYELFVRELSKKYGKNINRFKIGYDCVSCAAAVALSLLFFGDIRGVWFGTVLCALINGRIIGLCSTLLERWIDFSPRLSWSRYFGAVQLEPVKPEESACVPRDR